MLNVFNNSFLNVWQKAQRNGLAVELQEEAKVVDGQELPEMKTDKVNLFWHFL